MYKISTLFLSIPFLLSSLPTYAQVSPQFNSVGEGLSSGHYRTGRQAINSFAKTVGAIYLAEINVPGEVIIIEDDAPDGPGLPPGGHTGSPPTGGGSDGGAGEPGGGGDSGGIPSDKSPKKPFKKTFKPTPGGKCTADSSIDGDIVVIARGRYSKLPGDIWYCSGRDGFSDSEKSIQCQPEGTPIDKQHCNNGWPL
jgi:hypothetical protein